MVKKFRNKISKIKRIIANAKSSKLDIGYKFGIEFFYSKDEKQKAKEIFNQILVLPNADSTIKTESQTRLNRDLGE